MLKHKSTFWLAALITAWGIDFLFWEKEPGISFPIWTAIAAAALLVTAYREKRRPDRRSWWLLGFSGLFALLTIFRLEPFTRTLNHLAALFLMALLLMTFRKGQWGQYNLADYVVQGFKLFLGIMVLPITIFTKNDGEEEQPPEKDPASSPWQQAAPYLRGILIALPILAVLTALLASADPIFADRVKNLEEWINAETFFRGIIILFLTYFAAGAFLHGLIKSEDETLTGQEGTWPPRFLGFIESTMVLTSVNVLYVSFLIIQFRYFFGGEKNISAEGFTYAEYARRGFGELLAVAFLTLLLFIVLSTITKREKLTQKRFYSILTTALTVLIGLILFSSLQRLSLYEDAYGFTRLRTYSHICILWIGALYLGILVLEYLGEQRRFTLAALIAVAGFLLTMNAVNIDGFITRKNITRAQKGQELDAAYLITLSPDAVPALARYADDPRLSSEDQELLSGVLACQAFNLEENTPGAWQSTHGSRIRARNVLEKNTTRWEDVEIREDDYGRCCFSVPGEEDVCRPHSWD